MIRELTRFFIISIVLLCAGYDVWAYLVYGNPATISASLVRYSWYHPWIPFVAGALMGHLFFDLREPIDWPKDESK